MRYLSLDKSLDKGITNVAFPLSFFFFFFFVTCSEVPRCSESEEGRLRLQGFPLPNIGRVEVCHCRRWGLVCDGRWTRKESDVVCRQLGYSTKVDDAFPVSPAALKELRSTDVYEGPPNQMGIWLPSVQCEGDESALTECSAYRKGGRQPFAIGHYEVNSGRKEYQQCFEEDEVAAVMCPGTSKTSFTGLSTLFFAFTLNSTDGFSLSRIVFFHFISRHVSAQISSSEITHAIIRKKWERQDHMQLTKRKKY